MTKQETVQENDEDYIEDCPKCGSDAVGSDNTTDLPFLECFQCDHEWIP